jgi:hypothetical protein
MNPHHKTCMHSVHATAVYNVTTVRLQPHPRIHTSAAAAAPRETLSTVHPDTTQQRWWYLPLLLLLLLLRQHFGSCSRHDISTKHCRDAVAVTTVLSLLPPHQLLPPLLLLLLESFPGQLPYAFFSANTTYIGSDLPNKPPRGEMSLA